MGTDIRVFVEHHIGPEWVLVDVDPLMSSQRNPTRLQALRDLHQPSPPADASKGVMFWLRPEGGTQFVACLPLQDAAMLWQQTEDSHPIQPIDHKEVGTLAFQHFGCWNVDLPSWRILIAV